MCKDNFDDWVIRCVACGKKPEQLDEYIDRVRTEPEVFKTPTEVVVKDEGTYSTNHKLFVCTDCYLRLGMPSNESLRDVYDECRETVGAWTEDPE